MEITFETIKKLQQIELKMLEVFVQICEKENLQYYLYGGTLLGAIRHKGFIPWDDDVDIGMPRVDYEKFLICAQKYLPNYYFLQNFKTEKNAPFSFIKIRDSRTIYKEEATKNLKINHGIWIDIFPLDYCPKHHFLFDICNTFLKLRIRCIYDIKISLLEKVLRIISYIICPFWKMAIFLEDKLWKFYKTDTGLLANFYGCRNNIMPTNWYGKGIYVTFEHLKVKAPYEYNKYLTQLYGDYMELPPVKKRKPIHNIVEIKL